MDISEINKVAQRKNLNANAEKLREKISKENRNIIKLSVAQDTAYWDLKEQLRLVEGNHEKLQANMVEVQMQHEAISGQYQDELRLRPETLNKLSGTRQICDVLEDYSERLRDTLSRCKADQTALYDAYQRSGQVVRDIKTQQHRAGDRSQQMVEDLQEKIKLTSEHNTQLLQYFSLEKQRADAELLDVKTRLEAALLRKEELVAAGNDLNRKLDCQKHELQKKEEAISGLQSDIKRLLQEFNIQGTEMNNTIVKQEKELKETISANESLKQALTNQESFTKSICDQNNQLQEKIAALEEEQGVVVNVINDLRSQLEDSVTTNCSLKTELAYMTKTNEDLNKYISDKNQLLETAETEIQKLKLQLSALEAEKLEVSNELNKAIDATDAMAVRVQELTSAVQALEVKMVETEGHLKECREAADCKIKELTEALAEKDRELDSKASTITHLMSEVKSETDARGKLEAAMQKLKKEMEIEKDAAGEKERKLVNQVEQLETSVRNKESELSSRMKIILELRSDKERLHAKIESMQNKIDNIQKELTGPPPRAPRHPPEHDDNAVMLTPHPAPAKLRADQQKPTMALSNSARPFAVPHCDKYTDSMVLNFLSDSSMDGDNTLDPVEVSRRFEAISRGERVSPKPLSALKRRRSGVPDSQALGGLRHKTTNDYDLLPLAQVKEDLKGKDRTFFKTKRHDKPTKPKQAAPF